MNPMSGGIKSAHGCENNSNVGGPSAAEVLEFGQVLLPEGAG